MRILHVLDHSLPLHSGYAFRTLAILEQQRARGWDTVHLTGPKQGSGADAASVDGWQFLRTDAAASWWSRLPLFGHLSLVYRLAKRLRQVADDCRPDLLHVHSPVLNAIAACYVGRRLGIPVLYEIRAFWEDAAVDQGKTHPATLRYRLSRWLETRAAGKAAAVATICEGMRADLQARGIPAGKITVIPNAVDIDHLRPGAQRDAALALALGLGMGPVLGFIGSFYAYEGLELLIEAVPDLIKVHPNLKLLLVGGGPQQAAWERRAAQLGVGKQVVFAGRVPHALVAQHYGLIDILVYPRLPMRLTELVTPLKPLEAMALGRLIVASDVGGHRELIEHGKTGMLFKAGDGADLQRAILVLLDRARHWPAMRQAARSFVERERSWSASVARYQPVYESLLARRQAP